MLYSAGVVPAREHGQLAEKLVEKNIPNERVLKLVLSHDRELLSSICMKAGQQSCLTRYLNRAPTAAAPLVHPEAAAVAHLKRLCAAAQVLPDSDEVHEAIARRLIEQGVADETSLRDSLGRSPPAFNLSSIIDQIQAWTITVHLEEQLS
jgi:hypothetical protein